MYLLSTLTLPLALWPILLSDSSSLPFLFYKRKRRWEGDLDTTALLAMVGLVWFGLDSGFERTIGGSVVKWCGKVG